MINLYGLFGEKPEYPDPAYIEPVKAPMTKDTKEPKQALYTVGMNTDNMTQLTVGYPSSIMLTLNSASVAHLIRLLAVNIEDHYTVRVEPK